jgi:hypothetical protein
MLRQALPPQRLQLLLALLAGPDVLLHELLLKRATSLQQGAQLSLLGRQQLPALLQAGSGLKVDWWEERRPITAALHRYIPSG